MATERKIVLTGGGTAGHVVPHLAIIPYLQRSGWQIDYIGSTNGVEQRLIAETGIPFYSITSGKLRRYFSWQNFSDAVRVIIGCCQALRLLYRLKPQIVFSKGGYVSVPVAIAAFLLKIKLVTHESDITPGLATRIIAKFADEVWLAFATTQQYLQHRQCACVGIPVRDSLRHGDRQRGRELCQFRTERRTLMIIGGSLGSQRINTVVNTIIYELLERYHVIHIVGVGNKPSLSHSRYCAFTFITEGFNHLLASADLVISRAGANCIFEFLALHKPMLLVPLDAGSRGDQIANANYFEKHGLAKVLAEKKLTGDAMLTKVRELDEQSAEMISKQKTSRLVGENVAVVNRLARLAERPSRAVRDRTSN